MKPAASMYAAVAVSLALHAMLLWWTPQWEVEAPEAARAPIVATIEAAPAAPPAAVPVAPPASPAPRASRPVERQPERPAVRAAERPRPAPRAQPALPPADARPRADAPPPIAQPAPHEAHGDAEEATEGPPSGAAAPEYAPVPKPGPPAIDPGSIDQYRVALNIAARKYRDYPRHARTREWEGRATVRVQIGADGGLRDILIARSSGFELLDQSALNMLRKAQRDTPVPASLRGRPFSVEVTVVYELKE